MTDSGDPRLPQEIAQLAQQIAGLRAQLDLLSKDAEPVVVGRVVSKATGTIRQMSFGVLLVIIALAGYAGFSVPKGIEWVKATAKSEAEQAAKMAAERYMKEPDTRSLLQGTIEARVTEVVTPEATSIAVQQANEVLRDVTQLRHQLVQQLKDPRFAPPATSEEAFAYYGREDSTEKWIVGPYFRPLRGEPKAFPKANDRVEAIGYVFAHTNYVQSTSDRGWINAPLSSLGVIRPRDDLEVLEGKNVHDGNIWIKFKVVKRATN